jgi:hypothetical protein
METGRNSSEASNEYHISSTNNSDKKHSCPVESHMFEQLNPNRQMSTNSSIRKDDKKSISKIKKGSYLNPQPTYNKGDYSYANYIQGTTISST